MFKWNVVLALVFFAVGYVHAEYRDFMDTQGRAIRGKVLKYEPKSKVVTMERSNKKIARVPVTVFSEKDQQYIRDWYVAKTFEDKSAFKISAKRVSKDDKYNSNQRGHWKYDVKDKTYLITLQNRSDMDMSGLRVEYCIFYEQEIFDPKKEVTKQGLRYGKIPVKTVARKSTKEVSTDAVKIYTQELGSGGVSVGTGDGWNDVDGRQVGQVHGVWIRVYMETDSGVKDMREYCLPDSLSNSRGFATRSIHAGMNPGKKR